MSFAVFLPLLFSLGLCLVPVWLLRRQQYGRVQDYFVSSQYTPPEVIRNSLIAKSLRMAAFGPFFAFGASGDFWPVIVGSVCLGLGLYLVYVVRRPILEFLGNALSRDQSITMHEFIARQHGNDPRVRWAAASLTLFALVALITGEAFALSGFLKLAFGNTVAVRLVVIGALLMMMLYAVPGGHSGVMHSAQLQLGMLHLGLFGSTALLLYLHVSTLTPLPTQTTLAIVIVAVCCGLVLFYRRSRYVDTSPIDLANKWRGAKLLRQFEKILNPCISVLVVLIIVLGLMEFYVAGFSAIARDSAAFLQAGTPIPLLGLIALALLPLFYPLTDVTNWQRLAAVAKNEAYGGNTARWAADLRGIFRIWGVENPLLWLFAAMFGAIAAAAMGIVGGDSMEVFLRELVSGDNPVVSAAFSLLLIAVTSMTLAAMGSAFASGLCTIRYDLLPATAARPVVAGRAFFTAILVAFIAADMMLPVSFTDRSFLALIFALCAPPLAFAALIAGPVLTGRSVSARWALVILGIGAASSAGAVTGYIVTGNDSWLWAAAPACVGSAFLLFAGAGLSRRVRVS